MPCSSVLVTISLSADVMHTFLDKQKRGDEETAVALRKRVYLCAILRLKLTSSSRITFTASQIL